MVCLIAQAHKPLLLILNSKTRSTFSRIKWPVLVRSIYQEMHPCLNGHPPSGIRVVASNSSSCFQTNWKRVSFTSRPDLCLCALSHALPLEVLTKSSKLCICLECCHFLFAAVSPTFENKASLGWTWTWALQSTTQPSDSFSSCLQGALNGSSCCQEKSRNLQCCHFWMQ